ncbi:MAG TPA: hypothetical protein VLE02_02065 [Nitrosarchaeum sp.]|nr:hypothetical protein [Nitrosarchaeum sp.]
MIDQLILFYSEFSEPCLAVKNFVASCGLPVKVVKCDTQDMRNKLKENQITRLPALLIMHDKKQTIQIGKEVIIKVCNEIIRSYNEAQNAHNSHNSQNTRNSRKKSRPVEKPKEKKDKKKGLYDKKDSSEEESSEEESSEDVEFLEEPQQKGKVVQPTAGLMVGAMASGSAKANMSALLKEAEKMKKDRQSQLGYNPDETARS